MAGSYFACSLMCSQIVPFFFIYRPMSTGEMFREFQKHRLGSAFFGSDFLFVADGGGWWSKKMFPNLARIFCQWSWGDTNFRNFQSSDLTGNSSKCENLSNTIFGILFSRQVRLFRMGSLLYFRGGFHPHKVGKLTKKILHILFIKEQTSKLRLPEIRPFTAPLHPTPLPI